MLRDALAGGRLPLAAVRLTILQAMEAELRRRSRPAEVRGSWLETAGRFLADHGDLRRLPSRAEALGWLVRLGLEGRLPIGAAGRWDRAIRFLFDRVLTSPASAPGEPADGGGLPRRSRTPARRAHGVDRDRRTRDGPEVRLDEDRPSLEPRRP